MAQVIMHEEANVLRHLLPKDFYMFLKEAWHIIEPTTPFTPNWHIEYLAKEMQIVVERIERREPREKNIIINVPPGSTKSTLLTIMLPVWAWMVQPGLRIINASYESTLAISHATKSRDIIESDWFQQLFSDKIRLKHDLNRKSEYSNTKMGMRYATGVGGSVIGKHADLIIIDDPLNPKVANSEVKLKECNEWHDLTISKRVTNAAISTKILIMQRLHEQDLTGYLLKKEPEEWKHFCIPAELTKDVKPIELRDKYKDGLMDPTRIGKIALEKDKRTLGSLGYAGQMLQSPASVGGNIIKDTYFKYFTFQKLNDLQAFTGKTPVWDFVIDSAFTAKQINDPTGIMAYSHYNNNTYIRAAQSVLMELPELLQFINEFCIRNGYTTASRAFIEPKASGHSAEQMLRKYSKLNIQLDKAPTKDKVSRVRGALPYMESGRMFLLENAQWLDEFVGQCTLFPNAQHDEYVDLISMCVDKVDRPQGGEILGISSF